MRKLLLIFTLFAFACSSEDGKDGKQTLTLTFEDSSFAAGDGENSGVIDSNWWAKYIDASQYGGELLYGGNGYSWYDNATALSSSLPDYWQDGTFFGGGIAISNYVSNPVAPTYEDQLTIGSRPVSGDNFAICYVATAECPPYIEFKYGEGVIESLYVIPTVYTNEVVQNGNAFSPAMPQNGYIRIEATAIDATGAVVGKSEHYLYDGKNFSGWKKWTLSDLGTIKRLEFRMYEGTTTNGVRADSTAEYPTYPNYFAMDDIVVLR